MKRHVQVLDQVDQNAKDMHDSRGAGRIVARPHNRRDPQRSAIRRIELP